MLHNLQVFNITKKVLLLKRSLFLYFGGNWLISIINAVCVPLSNEAEAVIFWI